RTGLQCSAGPLLFVLITGPSIESSAPARSFLRKIAELKCLIRRWPGSPIHKLRVSAISRLAITRCVRGYRTCTATLGSAPLGDASVTRPHQCPALPCLDDE